MPTSPAGPAPVITISQDPGIVTVMERFDITGGDQRHAVSTAKAHITTAWTNEPDFVAAVLLRSRQSSGLTCYAQWRRTTTRNAPAMPAPSNSLVAALPDNPCLDSRCYSVEFSGHPPSVGPPTLLSADRTPYAHFGIFTVRADEQNRMVDLARANAPGSLGTPGLLGINFHRSLDGLRVVNLGLWANFDAFDSLTGRPGFKDDDLYWTGVAEFEPDFFDVAAIVTSEGDGLDTARDRSGPS